MNKKGKIKTISVMLDLDGTSDFIDREKAEIFMTQLEVIRTKFKAELATISISTHYSNPSKIKEVLDILHSKSNENVKLDINFYYGGIYDYDKNEEIIKDFGFNSDKVKIFEDYFINNEDYDNKWFAIIDDNASENVYRKYQDNHPMLVCRPSKGKYDVLINNFMLQSTTTRGFDGVIEVLDSYIESIKDLSYLQILDAQKNMKQYFNCNTENNTVEKVLKL